MTAAISVVLLADPAEQQVHVVDQPREVLLALGDLAVQAREAPIDRAEAAEQLAQVLAVALEPVAGARQQQPQVGLGVGVERLQNLVEVDVRRGVGDRDRVAILELACLLGARIELQEHVLEPGLGPQQDRRVLIDRQELAVDVHRDDGDAVVDLDVGDVADAHTRDPHGLPLAGGHGLRGLELGLELEGRLLDHGDPQPLVLDDHPGGDQPDHDQADHGQDVARVLADCALHPPPPVSRR